jgi:hypothetical protein
MALVKKMKGSDTGTKSLKKKKKKGRDHDDSEEEKFRLPTERSVPADDLGAYTWLIFGEKKIGKTTLTALFGKTLHLFTEPGGKALRLYPVVVDNWRKFQKAVRALRKDKNYDTVVIDIVDKLWPMSEDYTCEKLVIEDLAEEEWGKGWRAQKREFERQIDALLNIGKGVVFISHAMEAEVETRDGETYDRMQPTMHKKMREAVEGVVDIWAYYTYDKKRRVLQILGDDHVSAGHRLEGRFLTPDGRPIRRIDMGSSAKEAYANVVAAFNNEYEPTKSRDIDEPEEEESPKRKMKLKKRS